MRHFLVIWMLLISALNAGAQQKLSFNQDSLLQIVQSDSADDTQKIKALQDLSDHWLYIDSAKAMDYAKEAFAKSVKTEDGTTIAIGHYYVGGVYLEHYNLIQAKEEYQRAIPLLEQDSSYYAQRYLARVWHDLGAVYQREDDIEGFLDMLTNKACPILEKIGDSILLASNYYDIGNIFVSIKQYDKALYYFKTAATILADHSKYADAVDSYLGVVKALLYQEDFSEEKKAMMRAYLDKAHIILVQHPDAYPWANYYVMNGMYYQYVEENAQQALKSYDEGLDFVNKRQEEYVGLELLNRKYYLFYDQKRYPEARDMVYALYEKTSKYPLSSNKLIYLRNLVNVEEALGNKDRAFQLMKEYVAFADTVNKKQTNIKLNLIEQKYEHEKKEREIVELKAENQLKSAALKYNKAMLTFTVAAVACLLILLVLGYLLYNNKQKIAQQQDQLHEEQMQRMKKEQQVNFFNAMIQGQEQERKRLAGDLHDGLGGLLSNVKLLLSKNPCLGDTAEAKKQHQLILAKLDTAVNELRRIARNMMPETLLRFGLAAALRDFCDDLEKSGVNISLQTYGLSLTADKNQQIMIYRILQELISNAVRHAEAKNILVQCIQDDEKVYLTVEDDGKGFAMKEIQDRKGIGLHNVKNRVAYLNGLLDIQSENSIGTTINIEFNVNTQTEHIPAYSG